MEQSIKHEPPTGSANPSAEVVSALRHEERIRQSQDAGDTENPPASLEEPQLPEEATDARPGQSQFDQANDETEVPLPSFLRPAPATRRFVAPSLPPRLQLPLLLGGINLPRTIC